MSKKNLKIIGIIIFVVAILLILFIPREYDLNDGGTKIYKALPYEITKVHKSKADTLNEFYEGTIIKIFGKEIYNSVPKNVTVIDEYKKKNDEKINNYSKTIDNITINIEIPADWKYEELPQNTENDFYKYALKMYKNQEDKYAILYYYHQMFGVCGTGRTSKEIDLDNGNKAVIGYYDGNDIWQDISFYETNKYIAIVNQGLDKDESNQLVEFVKTIKIQNIEPEDEVTLSLKDNTLTSKGATIVLKNNSEEEYIYSPVYHLEKQKNEEWNKVEPKEALVWNDIAYILKCNESREININWENGYGELSKGKYRLVKSVSKQSNTPEDNSNIKYIYVEFEIK